MVVHTNNRNIYIVVQNTKGLSKRFENVFEKVGIQVHFKGDNTIRNLLVNPTGRDNITGKRKCNIHLKV